MRLESRIRALEARFIEDPLILYFADGSKREMCGRPDFLLNLLVAGCGGAELSSGQAAQLELIRQSAHAQEPGGGRMIEVLRCLPKGQAAGLGNH